MPDAIIDGTGNAYPLKVNSDNSIDVNMVNTASNAGSVKITDGTDTADVISTNGSKGVVTISPGHVSTVNSTSTPLTAGSTYTGTFEDVTNFGIIVITVYASHNWLWANHGIAFS